MTLFLTMTANQMKPVFTFTGEPQRLNKDIDVEDVEKQKQLMTSRCIHKNTTKKSRRSKKGIHKHQETPGSENDTSEDEYTGTHDTVHQIPEHKVRFGYQHRNHKRQKSRMRHTKSNKKNNACDDV